MPTELLTEDKGRRRGMNRFPLLLFLTIVFFVLAFLFAHQKGDYELRSNTREEALLVTDALLKLNQKLEFLIKDLTSSGRKQPKTQEEHAERCRYLMDDNPFILAVNLVDNRLQIKYVSIGIRNRNFIGARMAEVARCGTVEKALLLGEPRLSPPYELLKDKMGYSLMIPLDSSSCYEVSFLAEDVFGKGSPFLERTDCLLRVMDKGHEIFQSDIYDAQYERSGKYQVHLIGNISARPLNIEALPTDALIRNNVSFWRYLAIGTLMISFTFLILVTLIQAYNIHQILKGEQQLADERNMLRTLIDNISAEIYIKDKASEFLVANKSFCEAVGLAESESIAHKRDEDLRVPERTELFKSIERGVLSGDAYINQEHTLHPREGDEQTLLCSMVPLYDAKGEVVGLVGCNSDISSLKAAEDEAKRLVTAIEQTGEMIILTDTKGRIQYVNPAFELITGYKRDEVTGKATDFLTTPNQEVEMSYSQVWENVLKEGEWQGRFALARKSGKVAEIEAAISPIRNSRDELTGYVSVQRDITREIEMEKQLLQAHKMEAIGTLAGGIAHDFNNILAAIIVYTDMSLLELDDGSELQEHIKQVQKAADRGRKLVRQILAFSRRGGQKREALQLRFIVKEVIKMVESSLPRSIKIVADCDRAHDWVMANPTEIHQVVMNLVANAIHAMQNVGGEVRVTLDEEKITEPAFSTEDLKPGRYVKLTVSDTGYGMDETTRQRIFDPFFTTKKAGEGTGMGLSVVHGIIEDLGGKVFVTSEKGEGASFDIMLPMIKEGIAKESQTAKVAQPGHERILFVDDEEMLVDATTKMLTRLGYQVTGTTSSLEAYELFAKDPDAFDLLFTDQTMLEMSGAELAEKVLAIRRDMPIILCTGFSEAITAEQAKELGIREYAMKPLTEVELSEVIRKVLGPV